MKLLLFLLLIPFLLVSAKRFDDDMQWRNRYNLDKKRNDECQECLDEVAEMKNKMDDPAFQQELVDKYDQTYCKYLWKLRSTCIRIVTFMVHEFVLVADRILSNPRKLCEKAGYCKSHHRGKKLYLYQ